MTHQSRVVAADRAVSAGSAAAAVTRLRLTDFRCYASATVEADRRPVALTGPNGAGKTNLLEAISFLAPGRGLRRAALQEILRSDAGTAAGWGVAANVDGRQGAVTIATGAEIEAGQARRILRIDGKPAGGQGVLGEHLSVLWLTPQMDRLFQEGSGQRRRFLDRMAFAVAPGHADTLLAYEQAMRERNRLLKEPNWDTAWLSAVEDRMASAATAIAATRRDTVARLSASLGKGFGGSAFPNSVLSVAGLVEQALGDAPALAVEDALRGQLAALRRADAAAGLATQGPHRSDLVVRHAAKDVPATDCSTGEQKAMLIGIVLAQARIVAEETGALPVLLMDEVAAHLDRRRRAALFEEIVGLGLQAWMTGTEPELFEELGGSARRLGVEDARIRPMQG